MDEPASALDPVATLRIEELMAELRAQLHDRHRDPQHAAGVAGQRPDRVLHDGRRSRRAISSRWTTRSRSSPTQGPADRGLRVGSVRMSREETGMTDQERNATTDAIDRAADRDHGASGDLPDLGRGPSGARRPRSRAARGQGQRPAHGHARRGPDPRGDRRAGRPRCRRRPRGHRRRRADQRGAARTRRRRSRGRSPPRHRSRATCGSCCRSTT